MSTINTSDKILLCAPFVGCFAVGYKGESLNTIKSKINSLNSAFNTNSDRLKLVDLKPKNIKYSKDYLLNESRELILKQAEYNEKLKSAPKVNSEVCMYAAIGTALTVAIIVSAVALLAFTGLLSAPLTTGAVVAGLIYLGATGVFSLAAYEFNQMYLRNA